MKDVSKDDEAKFLYAIKEHIEYVIKNKFPRTTYMSESGNIYVAEARWIRVVRDKRVKFVPPIRIIELINPEIAIEVEYRANKFLQLKPNSPTKVLRIATHRWIIGDTKPVSDGVYSVEISERGFVITTPITTVWKTPRQFFSNGVKKDSKEVIEQYRSLLNGEIPDINDFSNRVKSLLREILID